MRALTIKQPWASLIMAGVKDVENRSWPVPKTLPQWYLQGGTRWRPGSADDAWAQRHGGTPDGPFPFRLWVHAGLRWAPEWCGWMDVDDPRLHTLERVGAQLDEDANGGGYWRVWPPSLPSGVLLGSVLVIDCHHADECWRWNPIAPGAHLDPERKPIAGDGERPGYCSPWAESDDVYHWTLTDPQPLPEPIPMKGRQRLWTVPDDVEVPA